MVTTKFLQMDFNGVIQEERIDTMFADFDEGLVTAFSKYNKTCKMHTFPMGVMKGSFL